MAKSQYKYGRRKESQVANQLHKKGYTVTPRKGSRGASDLVAKKGSKKWVVQVKATRKKGKTRISPNGRRRLKIQARKTGATPVHASVSRGKTQYRSVRTKRKLKP
jgi:Holliday junction resolvase